MTVSVVPSPSNLSLHRIIWYFHDYHSFDYHDLEDYRNNRIPSGKKRHQKTRTFNFTSSDSNPDQFFTNFQFRIQDSPVKRGSFRNLQVHLFVNWRPFLPKLSNRCFGRRFVRQYEMKMMVKWVE